MKRHLHNPVIKTHYNKHRFLCTDTERLRIGIVGLHFRHYYLNNREKIQTQLDEDPYKIPNVFLPDTLQTNGTIYPNVHRQCESYMYMNA